MAAVLEIRNLHVSVAGKPILKGVNLTVTQGEVHALMGRNGSGKSTLAYALMGHPAYSVDEGQIFFDGKDVLAMHPDERSRAVYAQATYDLSDVFSENEPGITEMDTQPAEVDPQAVEAWLDSLEPFAIDWELIWPM